MLMSKDHDLLITRRLGKEMKDYLLANLSEEEDNQILLLDFSGVKVLDFSWADEFVAKLAVEINADLHGNRALVVAHCSEDQFENINAALLQRSISLTALQKDRVFLIGDLKEPLLSTLNWVREQELVTARDLANHFAVAVNTASNRLSELAKRRLLFRSEEIMSGGGKQFSYSPLDLKDYIKSC